MADTVTPPTHEGTGHFDEKAQQPAVAPGGYTKPSKGVEDDEEEDIDALIEDLESQDGHVDEEEEEVATPGGTHSTLLPSWNRENRAN